MRLYAADALLLQGNLALDQLKISKDLYGILEEAGQAYQQAKELIDDMHYGLRIAELLLLEARISFYKKYLHDGEKSGELETLDAAKQRIEEIGQWGLLPEWERVQNELETTPLFIHEFKKKQKEENTMTGHFTEGYALIIGISNYAHPKIRNLGNPVLKDAGDVSNLLISKEQCGYLEANTHMLLDAQATAENIRKELQWLAASAGEGKYGCNLFLRAWWSD